MKCPYAALCIVAALMATSQGADAADFKVTLLGTGTPVLNVERFGMSIGGGGRPETLFDARPWRLDPPDQARIPLRSIEAVFITTCIRTTLRASGFLRYVGTGGWRRRPGSLDLYGPVGVGNVARGIELMFTDNNRIRVAGQEILSGSVKILERVSPGRRGDL